MKKPILKILFFSCISIRDIKTDTVWKSGEGKAILLLKELITE